MTGSIVLRFAHVPRDMTTHVPTADPLPVVGNALDVGRDPFGFMEEAPGEYGPVFRVSIPGLSFVCYADAELVERALVEKADRYRKDPRELETLGDALGEGLLTARGERWERGREHVMPAFYPGRLNEYAGVMCRYADSMVEEWADGERVDVHEEATELALSVIASTVFGVENAVETGVIAEAATAISRRFESSRLPVDVPLWVPTPANRRYRQATDELDRVVEEILNRRRGQEPPGSSGDDLCSALVDAVNEGPLSDEKIHDQLVTMLFAGHETTATALTYTLGLLATHPKKQARVVEEVREPAELTPETELPYTDRVIREALRLYPPAFMLFRETTEPDTVKGYEIPAGMRIVLPQWAVHRSERYYDDPLAFRPERWRGDDDRPEYAYFPFGGGKRQCIGRRFALLELRLTLATALRSVRVETTDDTDLSPTPALTTTPNGPVWLRVQR